MSRLAIGLNVILVAASAALGIYIARQISAPIATPEARRPAATPPGAASPETEAKGTRPGPGFYSIVASRNLFSPTRTEAPPPPPTTITGAPARPVAKPNLYGVVVGDGTPVAYLEDPTTKRVAGYRLGDTIAGGTVQTIAADRVVLARPEGNIDIRLHDPAKPRPAAPAGTPGAPPAGISRPGVAPPVDPSTGVAPSAAVPQPGIGPSVESPGGVRRRPLPPNILRRLPPGSTGATPDVQPPQ